MDEEEDDADEENEDDEEEEDKTPSSKGKKGSGKTIYPTACTIIPGCIFFRVFPPIAIFFTFTVTTRLNSSFVSHTLLMFTVLFNSTA